MKCQADPACIFPPNEFGLCSQHANDQDLKFSMHDVVNVHSVYPFDSMFENIKDKKRLMIGFKITSGLGSKLWQRQLRFGTKENVMEGRVEPNTNGANIPAEAQPVANVVKIEFPLPVRRHLPEERKSIVHKFNIGDIDGYITVGLYPDGTPGEIFLTVGKIGSIEHGLCNAWALLFSMSLQYSVPLEALVMKFKHMKFYPAGVTNSQNKELKFADSIVDYVVRWLEMKFINSNGHKNSWGNQYTVAKEGNA